jgi:hypothetical protein
MWYMRASKKYSRTGVYYKYRLYIQAEEIHHLLLCMDPRRKPDDVPTLFFVLQFGADITV